MNVYRCLLDALVFVHRIHDTIKQLITVRVSDPFSKLEGRNTGY